MKKQKKKSIPNNQKIYSVVYVVNYQMHDFHRDVRL